MQRVQQLIVLLLCSFSMSAMELVSTNSFSGLEIIMDDFLTTINCLPLNRQVRDTLRCTSKKCLKFILSQDTLNAKYTDAYSKKDQYQMACWKQLGGCFDYQEFANAIKNKKYFLAKWLLREWEGDSIWKMFYCSNLKIAIETEAVSEIVPVVKWLLCTAELDYSNFSDAFRFTKILAKQDSEVENIVELFKQYETDWKERKVQEKMIAQACSGLSIAACYGPVVGYYYPNQS